MTDIEQRQIIAANIKRYLEFQEVSQKDVADAIHVSTQRLNHWVLGKALPGICQIQQLADYFHIRKTDLIDPPGRTDNLIRILPILGSISCGKPIMMNEEHSFVFPVNSGFHADFILRASGDSMIGARIKDGDLVFIRIQDTLEDGEIGAIAIEDEALLKCFYHDPEHEKITLKAENPLYEDLTFKGAELENVHILGKAVAFLSTPE